MKNKRKGNVIRKTVAVGTAVIMLGSLYGCGNTSTTEESADSTTKSVSVSVESDILGMADTGNKTSLKHDLIYTSGPGDINLYYYDENGDRVVYEDEENIVVALEPVTYTGSATIDLGDVDDSLIDSSNAVVSLVDGNGYYADEMILSADSLDGEWVDGEYTYTLTEGDLEWNTWDYDTTTDYNSDREWSIMGGDGNGVYKFTFKVSGIKYDGQELDSVTFPVTVYIYGRSAADLSISVEYVPNDYDTSYTSETEQTDEAQWEWTTENEESITDDKPYMNDLYSDYFSLTWPEGVDASDITAEDVTVTLSSEYGDEYVLSTETAYGEEEYAVVANENETEIIVTYQQWAFVPVYNKMEITVTKGDTVETQTYDICSVAAYMVQTGGGGVEVDHTVTCYNYYGLLNLDLDNAANTGYTLSTEVDGTTYYYAEDESGNAYLSEGVVTESPFGSSVSAPEDAWEGDATEKYNIAVYGNVMFAEKREENTQDIEVDGVTYTFTENVNATKSISDIVADGATLAEGYNLNGVGVTQWAWTPRYQSGWTTLDAKPTTIPYVDGYYGFAAGSSNPSYDKLIAEAAAAAK